MASRPHYDPNDRLNFKEGGQNFATQEQYEAGSVMKVIPMAAAWLIQKRMAAPVAEAQFNLPGTRKLDAKLAIGALLFGIGWGIAGLCPGPAIAGLALNPWPALIFVAAMIAGMGIHKVATE